MAQFKELTIQKTPNGFLPILPLNGQWLEDTGFAVGCGVDAVFENSCLTLTVNHSGGSLQVESRIVRHRPRTILTVHAFWLKQCGFNIGDKVGLTLSPRKIQIQKIVKYVTADDLGA